MDTKEKHSRKNIEESSNFLSILCFSWTIPIFWTGGRRKLEVTDLYDPLKSDESEVLGDRLEREWKEELMKLNEEFTVASDGKKRKRREPNLMWAIVRMFWAPYMLIGLLPLIQAVVLHALQPILQGWIISYFDPGEKTMTRDQCLLYAGAMMLVTLSSIFLIHHTGLRSEQIGMRIRVACCSMIYRKVLRFNQTTMNNIAAGKVANLISNDVARFDTVAFHLHFIWITPLQVIVIGFLIGQSVGVAAIAGIGVLVLQTMLFQGYLSHLGAKLRSKIAQKTDERVQLMSELISGIQVIKMYSWEKPFGLVVSKLRDIELKLIGYASYLRGFSLSTIIFAEKVTIYLTLITFILMGNQLTAETTFVVIGLYNALIITCAISFPFAVVLGGEAIVSLKRLTEFLLLDEVECPDKIKFIANDGLEGVEKTTRIQQFEHGVGIEMINVVANWVHGQLPPTLSRVSMKIRSQSLCALVGPVGSGKSSVLQVLLNELPVRAGMLTLSIGGNDERRTSSRDIRISYASQDPWLFTGSIRHNILFGEPYDKERYEEVISVCALLKDFEQLPRGDMTFVGERGASLSGGQRARINLARAVYRDAELYLLDDPLSAVDSRVSRHLFEKCITGFLKGKTRILVTHQMQYLQQVDNIVVFKHGTVEHQGTYEELVASNEPIFNFGYSKKLEKLKFIEKNDEENIEDKTTGEATVSEKDLQSEDTEESSEDTNEEGTATGNLSGKVYWGYFLAGGNRWVLFIIAAIFVIGQLAASGIDYWVAYWTSEETLRFSLRLTESDAGDVQNSNETLGNSRRANVTESESWFDEYGLIRTNLGIYIYTACVISSIFIVALRSFLLTRLCIRASHNIHEAMFKNLLQATMRFFNTNPAGRILNRFSKDMGAMDEILPRIILEAFQIFSFMAGALAMVIIANNWMIIPTVIICVIYYSARAYYLRTAQNIRRLEGITKSPMFSHVSSTLDGLITIRSRGPAVEEMLRREFDRHQDMHSGAWYLGIVTASAFGFILDVVSWAFIVCVCFSFILMDDGTTPGGYVGLALSQAFILIEMVQDGVKQSAAMIAHMISVERLLQYTNLPKEGPFTTENPPSSNWPSEGALELKDVTMKYADHEPPVLNSLNVSIKPGWKVGIVGRTGAGKSSLISALFRLTGDGLGGNIILDDIDTKSIGLHELRPRISIIPQEPILFSTTLRQNLDPFEEYSDAEIWNSLSEVQLSDAISSLDFQVAGGGANFSIGQRQLICLARAILRNNRLIVLDEATANVDRPTDTLIQNTIRRRFADCTVLTIAHKLNTIMDSDRVLVMDGGCIVEFDHPYLLLKNRDGHFSNMLQQTGKSTVEQLTRIAENAYRLSPEFENKSNDNNSNEWND